MITGRQRSGMWIQNGMMEDIAVEELNRDKKGIRVKALRDHGYNNYADILTARDYDLSAVRGISEDTASPISETQSARCDARQPVHRAD